MWRLVLTAVLLAGCVQMPPSPQDIQAKKFEALPDKAVIYIVRAPLDSHEAGTLNLDEREQITTYRNTYYRWEVDPGTHRIAGAGWATAAVTLRAEAGRIYFVEQAVFGSPRSGAMSMFLKQLDEREGRRSVATAELL